MMEWKYIALLCIVLIPFLYISQFNHPSADDYCFVVKAQNEGFVNAQVLLFTEWSGRFFSTLMITQGPLFYNSFYLIKVFPVAVLFLSFISFFKLVDELYQHSLQLKHTITFGLSFIVLFLLGVNNLPEGLYSYTASLPYVLPFVSFVFFLGLLLKKSKRALSQREKILSYLLLTFIIGSNETAAVLMVVFFTVGLLFLKIAQLKVEKTMWFFYAFSCVLLVVILFSPGFVSSMENPLVLNTSFNELVLKGVYMTKSNMMGWVFKSPLLFFSFVFILFSKKAKIKFYFSKSIHPIFHLLIGFVVFTLLHVFSFFTIDYDHPTRLSIMLFGFFLVWWFFILMETTHYYQNNPTRAYLFLQEHLFKQISFSDYQNASLVGMVVFVLLSSNNLRTVIYETATGQLAMYDRENVIRYKMIEDLGKAEVIQFTVRPKALYLEDITTEKNAWQNNCYSYYYRMKDGITLAK